MPKRLTLRKRTRLGRFFFTLDCAARYLRSRMTHMVVQTCVSTAFGKFTMKLFILSSCLMERKKVSMYHLSL